MVDYRQYITTIMMLFYGLIFSANISTILQILGLNCTSIKYAYSHTVTEYFNVMILDNI